MLQLCGNLVELQVAPIKCSVYLPLSALRAHYAGGDVEAALAESDTAAAAMLDDLLWWTAALKAARPERLAVGPQ